MRLWVPLILLEVCFCSGYLILLSEEEEPGSLVFDAGLKSKEHHRRHYTINVDRSAYFVRKLLHLDHASGEVFLRQRLHCDGVFYPNLFTLYIDSTSNGTLDYVSIPLRVLIRGCADLISFEGMVHTIIINFVPCIFLDHICDFVGLFMVLTNIMVSSNITCPIPFDIP